MYLDMRSYINIIIMALPVTSCDYEQSFSMLSVIKLSPKSTWVKTNLID